jgi:uncharacterized metal-binding protein YceD (DUF177 family)
MKSDRQFVIPYKGLKLGRHDFTFNIDDTFFDDFEVSEITKCNIVAEVLLDKKVNLLEFSFRFKGDVMVTCDRCLEEFSMPVAYETKLFVKFGEVSEEQTDEILVLSFSEHELDLKQNIFEYIHLSLPYRRVHPNDKKGNSLCNKEMLEKLEEHVVHEEDNQIIDPRWDNLKNLLNNN